MDIAFSFFQAFWEHFSHSWVWVVVRFVLVVYVAVLIIDIILLFVLRGIKGEINMDTYGASNVLNPAVVRRRWQKVLRFLKSGGVHEWKMAIVEADDLVKDILEVTGYEGGYLSDQITQFPPVWKEDGEKLADAHAVRMAVVKDATYILTEEETRRVLTIYGGFLHKMDYID